MKKFSFDLENILELRKYREREAEIALGRAVSELNRIEQDIGAVGREKVRVSSERFALGYGVAELVIFDRYVQKLNNVKECLLQEAAQAETKIEAARMVYLDASRERDILDQVKKDEASEHRKQVFAEEAASLDDISGCVYTRKAAVEL
jgi:flagellar export protein FliJ